MPDELRGLSQLNLARVEDACLSASTDYRYAADQLDRVARFLRDGRLAQAEDAMQRAIEGVGRADAAFAELECPTQA